MRYQCIVNLLPVQYILVSLVQSHLIQRGSLYKYIYEKQNTGIIDLASVKSRELDRMRLNSSFKATSSCLQVQQSIEDP